MAYATPALAFRWQPIHPLATLRRSPNISSTVSTQATCGVEHGTYRSGESRAAGWRAGGTSAALGSESRIPWRSLRPCAAGGSLCRARDRVAIVLKLLLQPALRLLERWHIPRLPAALLLILALFGTIVGLGTAISGPAR